MGSLRRPRFRGNPPTRELPAQPPPPFGMIATQFTFRSRRKLSDDEPKFDAGGLVVLTAKGVQTPQYLRYRPLLRCCRHGDRKYQSAADCPLSKHQNGVRQARLAEPSARAPLAAPKLLQDLSPTAWAAVVIASAVGLIEITGLSGSFTSSAGSSGFRSSRQELANARP